ncbi:foldase protein PrsA [Virgibacillus natechei]|uniref:peptidylprolyl isomerase n=1 Tax=Virgibacillus natechei TaxID=1216297 RepID=A0ABS4IHG7_9BACI|nr:peptidyl-prolyl cis-trans isomerase [Virgibacillus natechei]MBP1970390.1 foldase protein PrsA [Virgibacillus natechei]UZD13211.1 peptidyl-prolyl cis-trans isomerase [Virgibacillus natechei]
MSRKLLLGIIVVLVITNIASLLFWNNDNANVASDEEVDIDTEEAVASIGGEEVSYQDWMGALRSTYGENQLKTMIDYAVVNQLANEKNIEVDDKVVEREVALLTSMQGIMTAEEFEAEEEAWREDIRYRYQLEKLLTEDATIPEEEIQRYYDEYGNQYDFTSTMQLSHILVRDLDTAEQVTEELEEGASFDLLAQEYSIDEETKDEGGYLGFINTNSQFFPNGYEEVAADIEEHSYSEPFRADRGIAIIYVHRKLPAIEFTYEEMKPYVESELALQELNQSLTATPLWEELEIDWIYAE